MPPVKKKAHLHLLARLYVLILLARIVKHDVISSRATMPTRRWQTHAQRCSHVPSFAPYLHPSYNHQSSDRAPPPRALLANPTTRHITSRWYSSPDCAPAAILDHPWIATHSADLGVSIHNTWYLGHRPGHRLEIDDIWSSAVRSHEPVQPATRRPVVPHVLGVIVPMKHRLDRTGCVVRPRNHAIERPHVQVAWNSAERLLRGTFVTTCEHNAEREHT